MVSMNERIVKMYRKALATGRTDARTMNWLQANAKKAVFGKLPRWGNNMSNTVSSQAAEAFKKGFANQGAGGPITGVGGTALGTMVGGIADAVNIPYQGIKNLYNAGVDFYNAGASDRNAINQEMTYLNAILEKINADAEAYRQANGDAGGNGMGANISPNIDNSHYGMGNQATVNNLKYNPNKDGL